MWAVIRRGSRPGLLLLTVALGLSLLGVQVRGQDALPIFDTHLHYSRDGWDAYPVPVVLGFLDRGGMIRFRLVDNRVRFDINLGAVQRSGLRVSARLLGVANAVRRAP